MKRLAQLLSFNSYVWAALAVGAALALLLARGGLAWWEAALLAGYAAAAYAGWRAWRTPRQKLARFDALAAFERALRDNRPTLVEFYSDNCAVCMTMRPVLERVESAAGHRLQMLRVDVKDPIGAEIAARHGVTLTPTFVLYSSTGQKEEEYTLALDRGRVLYWLDQQTISP